MENTEKRPKPKRVPAPNRWLKDLARDQGLFTLDVTEFDQAIEYFVLGHLNLGDRDDRIRLDNLVKALEPYGVQRDTVQVERTKYGGVYATRLLCLKATTGSNTETEAETEDAQMQEEHHDEQPDGQPDQPADQPGVDDDQHLGC